MTLSELLAKLSSIRDAHPGHDPIIQVPCPNPDVADYCDLHSVEYQDDWEGKNRREVFVILDVLYEEIN